MKRIHGALISARFSTDNQNPDTIAVQVEKCSQWCQQRGIPILGVYADEAISGMKESRPQFDAMMAQLRAGIGDTVVIYDQSRAFRSMTAWFNFRADLTAMGVEVVSVTQPMIGKDLRDPANFIAESSMAVMNQMWVLQTRQKVIEKMRFMARNGLHTGGRPALGYRNQDGRLVIDEAEAAIVRRIFSEYAAGCSYRQIIEGLNRDGLKTKHGNRFGSNSLHDLLHNEKYIGTLVYSRNPYRADGTRNTHAEPGPDTIRIEDALPAIISREQFEEVQRRMAANKRQQGGRPPTRRDYPLKGKVFCGNCKSAMVLTISKGDYAYYTCTQKKRQHNCQSGNIRVDALEQAVADSVRAMLRNPGNRETLIRVLLEQRGSIEQTASTQLDALTQQERELSRKLNHALDAVLDGMNSPELKARVQELEQQRAELTAQIVARRNALQGTQLPEESIRETIDRIACGDSKTNAAALSIVYRVEVYADQLLIWTIFDTNPTGHFDFDEQGVLITPGTPSGVPKGNDDFRKKVVVSFWSLLSSLFTLLFSPKNRPFSEM